MWQFRKPRAIVRAYARNFRPPPGNKRALDVGAGVGNESYCLASALGYSVLAIDNVHGNWLVDAPEDVLVHLEAWAKASAMPVATQFIDIRQLKLVPESYEMILALNSLQHFDGDDLLRVATKLVAALAPGGRLICSFSCGYTLADCPTTHHSSLSERLTTSLVYNAFAATLPLQPIFLAERWKWYKATTKIPAEHRKCYIHLVGDKLRKP